MSKHKSNVNPGQYKVAGRERQGEDIIHDRQKAMLTQNRADVEQRDPWPQRPAPTDKMPKQESAATQAGELAVEELRRGTMSALRKAERGLAVAGTRPAPKRARAAEKVTKREGRPAKSRGGLTRRKPSSARRARARRK